MQRQYRSDEGSSVGNSQDKPRLRVSYNSRCGREVYRDGDGKIISDKEFIDRMVEIEMGSLNDRR